MWIKSSDGALINLDQCHSMHLKEFRGGFQVSFDTSAGHAIQVKAGTREECQEVYDSIAERLTTADPNALAIVEALHKAAEALAGRKS